LALQISQHAPQLAVAELGASGKQSHERRQERRLLMFLERPGGAGDGDRLLFGEVSHVGAQIVACETKFQEGP
jgi:hypothetical protein